MRAPSVQALAAENVAELAVLVDVLHAEDLDALVEQIDRAPRIFVSASGRSLLALRAVSMRLMHIGLTVHVAGDVTTPAISSDDLLIVASARGGQPALHASDTAQRAGAHVVALTTSRKSFEGSGARLVVELPVRSRAVPTHQHAGSLFEQGVLIVGDAICRRLQSTRDVPTAALDTRHANL